MRGVGAAAATVARGEFGRFITHSDADGAGRHMHMLDRAGRMGGRWAQDSGRRDLKAHDVDAAAGGSRSQALPTGGVVAPGTLAAAQNANARRWTPVPIDQSRGADP